MSRLLRFSVLLLTRIVVLGVSIFTTTNSWASASALAEVDHKEIIIWSEGVRLAGDVYKPKNIPEGVKLPGILLVHGWAGTKDHLQRAYAPQFAKLGFVVLAFDYKGWGDSDGPVQLSKPLPSTEDKQQVTIEAMHYRKVVNPLSMLEDARAALHYLTGEPEIMRNNIGIWGTSLGGGIALVTAANDNRVKAFVNQIGAVNFKANVKMIPDGMFLNWERQRARGEIPSYPGVEAVVSKVLKGYPDWIAMKRYDPFASVEDLKIPTLIIDAEAEELFAREVNGQKLHAAIKDRVPTKYVAYPGGHYDMYRGENHKKALQDAQGWFVEHLKGNEVGAKLYKENCALCHSNPQVKAPSLGALKKMNRDSVLFAMTKGKMQTQAADLDESQRSTLADYLTSESKDPRLWEATMACDTDNMNSDIKAFNSGWGYGNHNKRYQSQALAGINANDLNELEIAWVYGFPGATEMRSQPIVTDDSVYVGVPSASSVYAFDLSSGCLRWVYRGDAPVRSALTFTHHPVSQQPIIVYGDDGGSVHALDASNGNKVWSAAVELRDATITGTPVVTGDKVIVPISTSEVSKTFNPAYECCRAHGGVRALDLTTGETLWTYHTTEDAQIVGENSIGTPSWGPSGAPIWTTPTIDEKRNLVYVGTGENYSHPTTDTSDSIIAINLDTGVQEWIFQALAKDAYNMACASYVGFPDGPNCPKDYGPDFDFGASVIITRDKNGRELLLAGQKSGDVYALNPDKKGELIWHTNLSDGSPLGGIHWGMSAVGNQLFVPLADPDWPISRWQYQPKPGMAALDISSGEVQWRHLAERDCELDPSNFNSTTNRHTTPWPKCSFFYGFSGAPTGLDDAVLTGALNGRLHAFSPTDGKLLWTFDTNKAFDSVNGVEAHGGSLDNAGPVVANGHLVLQSGYRYIGQMPGNVLIVLKKKAQ